MGDPAGGASSRSQGVGSGGEGWPRDVTDTFGRRVHLASPPRRVVSLVPSTTETLAELGCGARVVGRTRYCVHPRPWVEGVPIVGGTKALDLTALAHLEPDLILVNEEENRREHLSSLEALAPVAVARIHDLDGALADLAVVGRLLGVEARAAALAATIGEARAHLARCARPFRYAYAVWRDPWMVVNDDTFIASLLSEAGGINVFGDQAERYAQVTLETLREAATDVVLLPSEPYAFTRAHAEELGSRARLVDGELLCWHGARLVAGLPALAELVGAFAP